MNFNSQVSTGKKHLVFCNRFSFIKKLYHERFLELEELKRDVFSSEL